MQNSFADDLIIDRPQINSECSTDVILSEINNRISNHNADENKPVIQDLLTEDMKVFVYQVLNSQNVIESLLQCPEFSARGDTETITLQPIEYTFNNGRKIEITYDTQPKILKDRLKLIQKHNTFPGENSPKFGEDGAIWTNVNPAWYAIMVTEHGALSDFVGPDKNNAISIKYINDNIDKLYPVDHIGLRNCTSKTAISEDNDEINKVVHITTGIDECHKAGDCPDKDSNDYYIAGDADLGWIMYAEIAGDIILTIVTMGGGTVISGTIKATRAAKTLKNLTKTIKTLENTEDVKKYITTSNQISKLKKAQQTVENTDKINDLTKTLKDLEKSKDVKKYKQVKNAKGDLAKYLNKLVKTKKLLLGAKRGNMPVRNTFKNIKTLARGTHAALTGGKKINKTTKIARGSMSGLATKTKDFLFHQTLQFGSMLGMAGFYSGALYGVLKFAGDMYDKTSDSSTEFTNNIEFKPLLLLSADDIQGQENVVNYGMWFMWHGDAYSAEDDDAAFLQSMDFAEKFYQDLKVFQHDNNSHACDIDIFVVRPVIRNPGDENPELYYLIMNDEPWTTHDD
ncbi:MAG: hypothetical protein ACLRFI_00680 [Alphaproteobacteria bacterium]